VAAKPVTRRLGPAAAFVAAVLAGCAVASPSPSLTPTTSSAPSQAVESSASPVSAIPECADVFDASAGRVVMTDGPFRHAYGIATVNADGSDFRQVVAPGPERDQPHSGTEGPRWTPDGRILFDSNRAGGPDDWHVFVTDTAGGEPVQLTGGDDGIEWNGVMSPDGSTIVYAKALTTPDGPAPFGGGGIFASDADGGNERILAAVPAGTSPEFPEGAQDEWPDISPNGERVVFNRLFTHEGGLFVLNMDGTGLTRLVDSDLDPERPRWSPDGQWIVFHSNSGRVQTDSANLWVIAPDGSGLRQLTHESLPGQAWAADWSPDAQHIVFVHTPTSGPGGLAVIALDGTPTCTLWQGAGTDAGWDPDWGPAAAP